MAQLERYPRQVNTAKTLATPTMEKILRGSESYKVSRSPTSSSSSNSPSSPLDKSRMLEPEDDNGHNQKKSVLTKVKEKAKKLRYSLSKKKHEDGNITPAWGFTQEDEEEEEDAEYLGAPMYESEQAPEAYKENARQHPRAIPVIAENHILQSPSKSKAELDCEKWLNNCVPALNKTTLSLPTIATTANNSLGSSDKKMTGNNNNNNVPNKLTPSYSIRRSDDNPSAIFSGPKIQGLTVSKPLERIHTPSSAPSTLHRKSPLSIVTSPQTPHSIRGSKIINSSKISSAPTTPYKSSAPTTPHKSSCSAATFTVKKSNSNEQPWEKGVSVKEFFINKLEAGEDDQKALSQVISEVISPNKRTPGDVGVMEKVREAVNSLLRNDESSSHCAVKTPPTISRSSPSKIAESSSNAQGVAQEENHGKILQTN